MLTLLAPENIKGKIRVTGSKSIHNRMLVLNEVLNLNLNFKNKSTSQDTLLLENALIQIRSRKNHIIDVDHAGTDMRFLTAYLSITNGEWILTGSNRMKLRPIGELVKALRFLGADITFLETENFPPLKINGKKLKGGQVEIDGSISSQFISALLLIAPTFENGLELILKNELVSFPYVQMTIDVLKKFGVKIQQAKNLINVSNYVNINSKTSLYTIESDWSSASYWYSLCALSKNSEIELSFFDENSLQADSITPKLYEQLGIQTIFNNNTILLSNKKIAIKEFNYDFTPCPDIAQSIAVTCFGLGIKAKLTGLKTLKLKESDRIVTLKTELQKFGADVEISEDMLTINGSRDVTEIPKLPYNNVVVKTYNDHRIAMSFAPLSLLYEELNIQNPEVVSKSYPLFWEDLKSVGFSVNLQP